MARADGARLARPSLFARRLAIVMLVALVLRVVYVTVVYRVLGAGGFGLFDWIYYHEQANLLAHGHGFADPALVARGRSSPIADHPPLWPLTLTPVAWLGGTGYTAQRLVGAVLGALAVGVAGLLGRRVGGERVGLWAAAIAALYPVLIAADGSLMSETLYGLLVAVALLIALRLRDAPGGLVAAALGATLGLAALTRSEALILAALLGLVLALERRLVRWRHLAVAAAALVAVLAPWTARNVAAFHGDAPLISVNDAAVVAGANCPQTYHGASAGGWRFDCVLPFPRGGAANVATAPAWRRRGWRYARHHAGELPRVVALRVMRTWDLWVPFAQARFATERDPRFAKGGVIAFYFVACLAVAGAVLLRRRSSALVLLLLAPAVAATATSALGYGSDRFRHGAEIPLVVLAALAAERLSRELLARRVRA